MYRSINSPLISPFEQAEATHKDVVIASLKKELHELRDLETDFVRLNDEIMALESKYALLLDEKDRNQKEHRTKMDINKNTILDMRADVDSLKVQIHKASVEIEDTIRENTTLKRMCDNRATEISALMAGNRELEKDNEHRTEENKQLTYNIKHLRDEKAKLQAECQRLTTLLDNNISALKQAEKEARNLEANNAKLENILGQAENDNRRLLQQVKLREANAAKTQSHLDDLNDRSEDLKAKTKQLEAECARLEAQHQAISQSLEAESTKNKELAAKLKNLDNTIRQHTNQFRATEDELDHSVGKKQALKRQHFQLISDNRTLNNQIDKCLLNILEYEKLNNDLKKEIENYIESDQQARNLLNRKDLMRSLLEQVNMKLGRTSDQIAHLR